MQDEKPARRRVAFVTGAADGIGAAIAVAFARDGFDVAVSSRRAGRLANIVAQLTAAGARAAVVELDLASQSSIEQAMAAAIGACGHVDVLVNNAAIPLHKLALEVTRAEWEALMETNLTGIFFLTQQMGRHLVASGRPGSIISIASTHGVVGLAKRSTYGIAKAAVMHMTKMLAIEWAEHGIRVNAIAPSTVETPSRAAAFAADPGMRDALLSRIPLHRFCTTDEIAGAARYLASPQAAYITGHTLLLDGGLTSY